MIIEYDESKDECVLLYDGYDNVGNHIEAELSGYCDIVEGSYIEYAKRNRMSGISKRANVVKQPKTKKLPVRK